MSKFLETTGITYTIANIIKDAKEQIYLISPYLKICDRFKAELEDANKLKKDIRIVYGKADLKHSETEWLNQMDYIRTSYCENLHAKCYMNEETALITSMNLYEFSQVNNFEMGIMIKKSEEPELYQDIKNEVMKIMRTSRTTRISIEEKPYEESENGFCIRCGCRIQLDKTKPYCKKCYENWNIYKNQDYCEKKGFCHHCGKPNQSSFSEPLCNLCVKKS